MEKGLNEATCLGVVKAWKAGVEGLLDGSGGRRVKSWLHVLYRLEVSQSQRLSIWSFLGFGHGLQAQDLLDLECWRMMWF